jgi:hypothetical protein
MNANDRVVKGPDGMYGVVDITCWPNLDEKPEPEIDMRLCGGCHVTVPADALIEQKDGSFYLPWHQRDVDALPRRLNGKEHCWPCEEEKVASNQA